jgi:hypothetical protein
MLDIWPALPLFIHGYIDRWENVDNIISALNHKNRVCRITLVIDSGSPLNIVVEAMQEPFPELSQLTDLRLKFSSFMERQPFPIHSWVDPPTVCDQSSWMPFHIRDYRSYFCQPLISIIFAFRISLIPDNFHPN